MFVGASVARGLVTCGWVVAIPAEVLGAVVEVVAAPTSPLDNGRRQDGLTGRDAEVLRLIAAGLSNPEIGQQLYVSEATIKTHIHNILTKTGSHDRSHAIADPHRQALLHWEQMRPQRRVRHNFYCV
jgi:DNA-binding NarL/FixJ family response regulator